MKKILILANNDVGLYKFRKELIEELLKVYKVYISLPYGEFVPELVKLGCEFVDTQISRRGTNPITDFRLILKYRNIIKHIKPDVVLTYTIKPNVYGGLVCKILGTPYISNITGLGTSIENKGLVRKIALLLYKIGLSSASAIFFQNTENKQYFIENKIVNEDKIILIPGSGVNLDYHKFEEYPEDDGRLRILFIGRIMKDKGIEELFKAASIVKKSYPNVEFHLIGSKEEDYSDQMDQLIRKEIIYYHGRQNDVRPFIRNSHVIINPSYHEGMSNVLLEAASTGRPVLASKVPGCKETFDENVSGLGFEKKNIDSLVKAIIKFIELPYEKKKKMGVHGRKKVEKEFDRNIVINAYLKEISKIIHEKEEVK